MIFGEAVCLKTTTSASVARSTHPHPLTLEAVLRYAITNRSLLPGNHRQQQEALLQQAATWASLPHPHTIHSIQLREKDLTPTELTLLTRHILAILRTTASTTKLLLNASSAAGHGIEIALAEAAHGIHLTSTTPQTPEEIRSQFAAAQLPPPILTISCHTLDEVEAARLQSFDAILFAPGFSKALPTQTPPGTGLSLLRATFLLAAPTPVLALGGVTPQNTQSCLDAGAAGIAAIRLFCPHPSE